MSRQNRFDWFASRSSRRKAKAIKPRRLQLQRKLRYETLEDRRLLAVIVDTTSDHDDGALGLGFNSLREAIAYGAPGEEIQINTIGTIDLFLGELQIERSLEIVFPDPNFLTINGNGTRVFNVDDGLSSMIDVTISGLTITGGEVDGNGGGIRSTENLTLINSIITGNKTLNATGYTASPGVWQGNSGADGGGIWATGTTTIIDSQILSNLTGAGADSPGDYSGPYMTYFGLSGSGGNGAGIWSSGMLTITNSTIADNTSGNGGDGHLSFQAPASSDGGQGGSGGGVWSLGTTTISGTDIHNNGAGNGGDGGRFDSEEFLGYPGWGGDGGNGGGAYFSGDTVITNSSFIENQGGKGGDGGEDISQISSDRGDPGHGGDGGAIWSAADGSTIDISRSTIALNFSGDSGDTEPSDPIFRSPGEGGGIFSAGLTSITDSLISNNTAFGLGGGIAAGLTGGGNETTIIGSTIRKNAGTFGGGLRVSDPVIIINSTITENTASEHGGGVDAHGLLTVSHSTIAFNAAVNTPQSFNVHNGGGIYLFDDQATIGSSIDHTIVSNNTIGSNAEANDFAGQVTATYSIVGTDTAATITDNGGNQIGTAAAPIDPLLAPYANYGGIRWTHALLPNSPAIDAGDPNFIEPPFFDQRGAGFTRVSGRRIDIGAFERQPILVDTLTDIVDGNFEVGQFSLREAIDFSASRADHPSIAFDPALTSNGSATITLTHGELLISESLTIEGPGPGVLIIDASGNDPTPTQNNGDGSRIFNIGNPAANNTITISGLTLTGGDSNADGGAIFSVDDLSLIDLVTIDNSAQIRGGGVYVNGEATIVDSRIADNVAALEGGGVYMAAGSLLVDRSIVEDNQASAGKGGGLATTNTDLVITTSSIFGNTAATNGGGIDNFAGSLTVRDSTIALNVSNGGGGISTSNIAIIGNSTISGNFGGTGGAGGLNAAGATITNSTLIKNTADAPGGGILGNVTLINTIVADNTDTTGQADDISGSTSATHSLIGDNTGSGLATTPDGTPDANGNLLGPAFFESALTVSVQMAAMGEFDLGEDDYLFEYSIDDGPFLPLFTSLVDQGASQDYFLDSGTQVTLADPLLVNGTLLNDDFRTLTATIPNAGNEINIRFTATSNGGSEAFAWRNLLVRDNNFNTIGRAASFDQANDLFTAFVPIDPINVNPYDAVPGDMFGIRSRSNPGSTGLPFAIADDSLSIFPADTQGIVGENDSGRFFGVVDTINGVGNDTNSALWVFNFGGVAIDPLLGPLADNGGGTLTHNLLPGSVAIDAGDPALATPPVFDQRGNVFNRIVDGNGNSTPQIDIGAVELQTIDTLPFTLLVDTPTDTYDGDFSPGEVSLREALSFANLVPGADTIDFDPALAGGTISLLRGQLNVTDSLTINGLGADQLTIDATSNDPSPNVNNGDGSRVFSVNGLGTLNVDINGLTITGADVSGNGGGIFSRENLDLTEVSVSGNVASGDGGGIYQSGGSLTVSNSTLDGNTAQDWGGAVRNSGGVLSVFNSAITHNSAHLGGGIYSRSFVGTALIDSSTLSGNTATGHGGGVDSADGDLFIRHSTITANTAPAGEGSGISSHDGTTEIYSSIVAGNTNSDVDDVNIGDSTFTSGGYNLIGTGNATINFTNNDLTGVDDPLLGPLGDNGGPTFTHALLPGSPAIDESDPTFTSLPIGDQRGDTFARVADGDLDTAARLDIGAYELQPPSAGLSADFDGDTDVDGADFLSWQRGFGTTNGAAKGDGDANGDGAVNGSDLAVWNGTYGQTGGQTFDFTDQLIAYWPFDSGGSDASGNGLDVNLVGSATTAATGVFGNALTLNNPQPSEPPNTATAWAERPIDDDVLNLVSTDFTIQAWFNLADANGKEQALLDKLQGSGSGGGWTMTVEQQAGAVQFYSSSGAFVSTSLPKISTGVWHQFIVRSDSSGVDFIFDGVTLVENLELPAIQAFSEELHIGRRTDGSPPAVPGDPRNIGLNGRIDDVAIWQRSLTANDIQALWNDGFGRPVIAVAAASGQQAAAVSTVATIPELATTSSVEIQHPSNESELVTSSIARSTFPANISLQLNTHEQPSTRLSFNPSTERRAYRTLNDFSSYQPLETPTLPTTNRFDVAISLLALPEQESEASHESVDHAFDEFGEEELVLQPL